MRKPSLKTSVFREGFCSRRERKGPPGMTSRRASEVLIVREGEVTEKLFPPGLGQGLTEKLFSPAPLLLRARRSGRRNGRPPAGPRRSGHRGASLPGAGRSEDRIFRRLAVRRRNGRISSLFPPLKVFRGSAGGRSPRRWPGSLRGPRRRGDRPAPKCCRRTRPGSCPESGRC